MQPRQTFAAMELRFGLKCAILLLDIYGIICMPEEEKQGVEPVGGLKAVELGSHEAQVSWDESPRALLYSVCWDASPGGEVHYCANTTATSATLTDLRGVDEGGGLAVAVVAIGPDNTVSSRSSITLQRMDPVETLSVADHSTESVTVSWPVPADAESDEQVDLRWALLSSNPVGSEEVGRASVPASAGTYEIGGLEPCRWYNVSASRVRAGGARSRPVVVAQLTAANGTLSTGGELAYLNAYFDNTDLLVSWDLVGGCASHVEVCWERIDHNESACSKSPTHLPATRIVQKLPRCSSFHLTATALSDNNTELDSRTINVTSGPGLPRNVTVLLEAPGTLNVTWLPPAPGEDCVQKYFLYHDYLPPNTTEYRLTGLPPCVYAVVVLASMESGMEDAMQKIIYTSSGLDAPGLIRGLRATATRSRSMRIEWDKPREQLACLKKYQVCWKEANASAAEECEYARMTSYPGHTIAGLEPSTEYSVSVAGVGGNATGNSTSFDVFTGPEAVSDVKVRQVNSETVSLTWPETPGTLLYSVCWGLWGGVGSRSCFNLTESKATLSGLEELARDGNYTVIVRAVGPTGSSSDPTALVLQKICPVANLSVTDRTGESMLVSWDLRADCQKSVDYFEVCLRVIEDPQEDCDVTHLDKDAFSYTFFDLTGCTWYNVSVTAVYVDGLMSEVRSVQQFIRAETDEDPPPPDQINAFEENGVLEVRWDLPTNSNCAQYMFVSWIPSRKPSDGAMKIAYSYEKSIKINDPVFCSTYNISILVVAPNNRSSVERTMTHVIGPGPPRNVVARSPSPGTQLITWDPPLPGDDCVDHYAIDGDVWWGSSGSAEVPANTTEHLLTNQPLCTFIPHTVTAVSSEGLESKRVMVYTSAGLGAPGEVRNLQVVLVESHSVHLQWSTPDTSYGCLKKYSVCWKQEGSQGNETCAVQKVVQYPQHSISGLKSCTNYHVNVSAQGEVTRGNASQLLVTTGPEAVSDVKVRQVNSETVSLTWPETPCTLLYSVCWGLWGGLGSRSCYNLTESKATLSGLGELARDGNYTVIVRAVGPTGSSSDPTALVLQKICPVANLSVTDRTGESMLVSWDLRADCQKSVDYFEVCLRVIEDPQEDCNITHLDKDAFSYTFFDLTGCTWYNVSVTAVYVDGLMSEVRSFQQFIRAETDEDPPPPDQINAFEENGVLEVRWDLPTNSNCAQYMFVSWIPSRKPSDGAMKIAYSYEKSIKIKDLVFCSTYNISILVVAPNNRSSEERTMTHVIGPGPPRNVVARSPSPGTQLITWDPPLPGDDCVDHYAIDGGFRWGSSDSAEVPANTTEHLLTDQPLCTFIPHTVTAVSSEGLESKLVLVYTSAGLGAPGEVRNLQVVLVESHSVHLQWSTPDTSYGCLKKYSVCWKQEGSQGNETCAVQKVVQYPQHSISGLKSCTNYHVNVSAQGEVTRGNASQLLVTTGPEPVGNVAVTSTYGGVTLEWTEPRCASSYSVCWGKWINQGQHNCSKVYAPSIIIVELEDMRPGDRHTVIVRAVGEDGNSSSSPAYITLAKPKPVENFYVTNFSSESVSVGWAPYNSSLQDVTHLELCVEKLLPNYKIKPLNNTCTKVSTTSTSYSMDNLDTCNWYNITVAAVSVHNIQSPLADVLWFAKSDTNAPEKASDFETVQTTSTSIRVRWNAPANNTECLVEYLLCWKETFGGNEMCQKQEQVPHPEYTLTELEACTEYTISLTTVGTNDTHGPTIDINQTTGPEAVSELVVARMVIGEGELTVSWQPSPCARQYQVCWGESSGVDSSNRSCEDSQGTTHTLTGLQRDTNYTVVVVAVGPSGSTSDDAVVTALLLYDGRQLLLASSDVTPTGAVVSWDYFRGEGPPGHHLNLCATLEAAGDQECEPVNVTDGEALLTDLQPCSGYRVRATAVGNDGEVLETAHLELFTGQAGEEDYDSDNTITGFVTTDVVSNNIALKWDGLKHKRCIKKYVIEIVYFDRLLESVDIPNDTYTYTQKEIPPCVLINFFIYAVLPDGSHTAKSEIKTDTGTEAPGDVEDIEIFDTSSRSIQIKWRPPTENVYCLVRYMVCWQAVGLQAPTCVTQDHGFYNSHSITRLEPCTNYSISVAAMGSEKDIGNATYIEWSTGPGPVRNLTASVLETHEVTLNWEAPECARAFKVCWGAWSGRGAHSCDKTDFTTYTVREVTEDSNYTVTVQAQIGDGQLSDKTILTWNESFAGENKVTGFEVTKTTPFSIHLKWNGLARKELFDYYVLTVESMSWQNRFEIPSNTRTYVVDDLEPCDLYFFGISAILPYGDPTKKSTAKADTSPDAPGEINDLEVFHTSSSAIHLQWKPPTERVKCLMSYLVCWHTQASEEKECNQTIHSTFNTFSIVGLKACTVYDISVASMGSDKDVGNATLISWSTGPKPVQALTAMSGTPGEVALDWEAPECARAYLVCWGAWASRGNHSCGTTTTTSYAISGLEEATAYSISVQAEIEDGQLSDKFILTWNGTAPNSLIGHVSSTVDKVADMTVDVARNVLGSIGR